MRGEYEEIDYVVVVRFLKCVLLIFITVFSFLVIVLTSHIYKIRHQHVMISIVLHNGAGILYFPQASQKSPSIRWIVKDVSLNTSAVFSGDLEMKE